MWICTQHGFFSIVRKGRNEVHVRARVRADIERLKVELDHEFNPSEILELPEADYRYRIICGDGAFEFLMQFFTDTLDYDNFKARIASLPDQRAKTGDYHNLWHAGVCWQQDDTAKKGGEGLDFIGRAVINKRTQRRGVITSDGRWCWIVRYDQQTNGKSIVVNAAKHSFAQKWEFIPSANIREISG
jgi:hypothetical protein